MLADELPTFEFLPWRQLAAGRLIAEKQGAELIYSIRVDVQAAPATEGPGLVSFERGFIADQIVPTLRVRVEDTRVFSLGAVSIDYGWPPDFNATRTNERPWGQLIIHEKKMCLQVRLDPGNPVLTRGGLLDLSTGILSACGDVEVVAFRKWKLGISTARQFRQVLSFGS